MFQTVRRQRSVENWSDDVGEIWHRNRLMDAGHEAKRKVMKFHATSFSRPQERHKSVTTRACDVGIFNESARLSNEWFARLISSWFMNLQIPGNRFLLLALRNGMLVPLVTSAGWPSMTFSWHPPHPPSDCPLAHRTGLHSYSARYESIGHLHKRRDHVIGPTFGYRSEESSVQYRRVCARVRVQLDTKLAPTSISFVCAIKTLNASTQPNRNKNRKTVSSNMRLAIATLLTVSGKEIIVRYLSDWNV